MYQSTSRTLAKSGFTLIELLVVISIIGLIAAVVLVNLNLSRIEARNTKRKEDVAQLRKALELYYNEHQDEYPHNGSVGNPNQELDISNLSSFLSPAYTSQIPNDPKKAPKNYQYVWSNGGKDYGVLVPFGNDGGQDCKFRTPNGNNNWFKIGPVTIPDCTY